MMSTFFSQMNWGLVFGASIAYFVLGALWYSPLLFANSWMSLLGRTREELQGGSKLAYLYCFILIFMNVCVLSGIIYLTATSGAVAGMQTALITGLGLVATTFAINYLFQMRPVKLYLIDAGYHLAGMALAGLIIGMWS
jgi:hypothetical protein